MLTHATLLLLAGLAQANDLDNAIRQAAAEHQVPVPILSAIGWEATRWDQNAHTIWGGWGMLDLQEGDRDPSLEHAAILLNVSPDLLIKDYRWNLRGGAAILAEHARRSHGGELPAADDLLAWWDAVRAFSRSDNPTTQAMYASTIFEVIDRGVTEATDWGITSVDAVAVDFHAMRPVPPPTDPDYSGAYQYVQACCYSNYSRGPSDINYIVVHTVQGSYSSCISWFQNCSSEASAHYVVRSSDGQVTQMVKEEDVGWHAGNWDYNLVSVGIEHEGYVDSPGTWYTSAMYAGSAALVADIAARQSVSIDRSHIIGHYEVPGATHTDPGSGWDWDYYMSLITSGEATGTLLGVIADSDIYNGDRLVGANVWLDTGESTVSGSTGYYYFYDLPLGTYTVHAKASGYQEGTCSKELTGSGEWWCSIALIPDEDDTDPGGGDTGTGPGPDDTGSDPGPDDSGQADNPVPPPGALVPIDETGGGCGGCAQTPARPAAIWLSLLGLLALVRRRRPAV